MTLLKRILLLIYISFFNVFLNYCCLEGCHLRVKAIV